MKRRKRVGEPVEGLTPGELLELAANDELPPELTAAAEAAPEPVEAGSGSALPEEFELPEVPPQLAREAERVATPAAAALGLPEDVTFAEVIEQPKTPESRLAELPEQLPEEPPLRPLTALERLSVPIEESEEPRPNHTRDAEWEALLAPLPPLPSPREDLAGAAPAPLRSVDTAMSPSALLAQAYASDDSKLTSEQRAQRVLDDARERASARERVEGGRVIRPINRRTQFGKRQVALLVTMAVIVAAMIAPFFFLGGGGPSATDPAYTALSTYAQSLLGNGADDARAKALAGQFIRQPVGDGSVRVVSFVPGGPCWELVVSASGMVGPITPGAPAHCTTAPAPGR